MARLPAAACLAAGVLLQLLVAALAASTLPAQPWNDGPSKAVPLLEDRIAAAASAAAETCHVHVGLFFGTTMNGLISDQRRGNAARVPYKLVISKLAPEAKVIQLSYGQYDRAQTIHAIALFPGDVQRGLAAANALAAKLRDPAVVRAQFDTRLFGATHFETVGEPFLADATGDAITNLAFTQPVGMITMVFYDKKPAEIGPQLQAAYMNAIKQLVPGARVDFKTHFDDGDWTGPNGEQGVATALKLAFDTSISGVPADQLNRALAVMRSAPQTVWPLAVFGQVHAEDGWGVRWRPLPGFRNPCDQRTSIKFIGFIAGLPGASQRRRLQAGPAAAAAPVFDRAMRATFLAALNAALPSGSNSSVDAVANAPGGFRVATTSLIPGDSQHPARVQLARTMLDSDTPLGPKPLGPNLPAWVFFVQANVLTGQQQTPLYGTHLLVTSTAALNGTHARATALAFPSDAYVKFEFTAQPGRGGAATLTSPTPTVILSGLTPQTAYTLRASGVVQNNQRRGSANSLPFTTGADPTITLTKAEATSPTTGTATAAVGPGASFASYVFYAKSLACAACQPLVFPSASLTAQLTKLAPGTTYEISVEGLDASRTRRTPGKNKLQLTTLPQLVVTSAVPVGLNGGTVTLTEIPKGAFSKFNVYLKQTGCAACPLLSFSSRTTTVPLTGLAQGTKYNVTASGVQKNGKIIGAVNVIQMTTNAGPALIVKEARAASISRGTATAQPRAGLSFAKYIFTVRNGTCAQCTKTFESISPFISFGGLMPNTTYNVTVAGLDAANKRTEGSNWVTFRTPAARWVDATTGEAEAEAPVGVTYTGFKFTAMPSTAGLPNATVTVASTKARLLGLSPLTGYTVSVVGIREDGSEDESLNTMDFETPAESPSPSPSPPPPSPSPPPSPMPPR
ncbi:receptor-type tyrosine- phosphatase eta [Chlorella sorokiniana]|uniref:Receptor-type tyrosine-phosphatase eta n=1 Tax=Chlorella sorokiniana TaxID=3076 RepID=A0A2P6TLV2_CHLSO|nr:receptor-type tyrosine- phosphatase eta [Chlorella sorokiniana]|eukprot:PRW45260.1 receptor-type tyrosine- phosphatase eta [Chlorella sorokiniana]